jgi:hypothetical protein
LLLLLLLLLLLNSACIWFGPSAGNGFTLQVYAKAMLVGCKRMSRVQFGMQRRAFVSCGWEYLWRSI